MNYEDFEPVKDLAYNYFDYQGKTYAVTLDTVEDDWATFLLQDEFDHNTWHYAIDFRVTGYDEWDDPIFGDIISVEQCKEEAH